MEGEEERGREVRGGSDRGDEGVFREVRGGDNGARGGDRGEVIIGGRRGESKGEGGVRRDRGEIRGGIIEGIRVGVIIVNIIMREVNKIKVVMRARGRMI